MRFYGLIRLSSNTYTAKRRSYFITTLPAMSATLASVAAPHALILASSSPYRQALLTRLRYPFTVSAPNIDETPHRDERPPVTAIRLARQKAIAIAKHHPGSVVIGSDQVAVCDAQQLGKPGTHARAMAQLQFMRDKTVRFHTAVCVVHSNGVAYEETDVITDVRFRDLPDAVLNAYLLAETPYDVAGSAKAEGLGIVLLESVQSDDPTALIGLPLIALSAMLARAGITLL